MAKKDFAYQLFAAGIDRILRRPLGKKSIEEINAVRKLKERCKKAALGTDTLEATDYWMRQSRRFLYLLDNDDPRQFLRWDVIRKTMFVGGGFYLIREFMHLRKDNWLVWKYSIRESWVGNPPPFPLYFKTSGNRVHNAYHISRFMQCTGIDFRNIDLVFEFGGGYGCMCSLLRAMGFDKKYFLYDIPLFSALQKFYLKMIDSDKKVYYFSSIGELRSKLASATGTKLFIAAWSLSETPLRFRARIMELLRDFDFFLICYQENFLGINNRDFFAQWVSVMPDIEWRTVKIGHLPHNQYLFGKKKTK